MEPSSYRPRRMFSNISRLRSTEVSRFRPGRMSGLGMGASASGSLPVARHMALLRARSRWTSISALLMSQT